MQRRASCARRCELPCTALPACAYGVFVHVQKTGGTTTRVWLQNQTGFEYTGDAERVLRQATKDAAFLRAHPRYLVEFHGGLPSSFWELAAALRNAPHFHASGCRLVTFTSVREPKSFILSNMHDSFRHSFFRRRFVQLLSGYNSSGRPETEYVHPRWHTSLPTWAPELANMQSRTFLRYAASSGGSADAQLSPTRQIERFLDRFDVVGLTERGHGLYVRLIRALGLQTVNFDVVGVTFLRVAQLHQQHPEWAEEEVAIAAVAKASHRDARLHAHAVRLEAAQIEALPGGRQTYDCQLAALKALNAAQRVYRRRRRRRR